MKYPDFFDSVPAIRLYDPLAEFLGTFENGLMDIGYLDCVKFAGHSCPTVAGAYIMTRIGLGELHEADEIPARSRIRVYLRDDKSTGVTGVTGSVAAYICGAADEGGFPGMGGSFSRRDLLEYGRKDLIGDIMLQRTDNGKSTNIKLDTSMLPPSAEMKALMPKVLNGSGTEYDSGRFRQLWQERVAFMLNSPERWNEIAKIV